MYGCRHPSTLAQQYTYTRPYVRTRCGPTDIFLQHTTEEFAPIGRRRRSDRRCPGISNAAGTVAAAAAATAAAAAHSVI